MRLPSPLVAACALVVACAPVAGCATEGAGPPAVPTAAPTAPPAPSRPREVRLDGVDPCLLLTPEQRARLGLTSQPKSTSTYVQVFRGDVTTCSISGSPPESVLLGVSTVTTVGVERWRERDVDADVRPAAVAGFPAVIVVPRKYADYCSIEVDIAAGQLLDVQLGGGTKEAVVGQDELCLRAEQSAGEVMQTLLAR